MRKAISTLAARRKANMGTFFVLSGNVRDVCLDTKSEQTGFLAIADLLRRQFPEHALVELTLSRGLACDDPEKLESIMTAISPPKADDGKQPGNEMAELLRQAEAQSGQRFPGDDGNIASFAEAVTVMRTIWKQHTAKVLLLAPRLESLLQNSQNSPPAAALADALLDLAAKSLSPDTCPHLFVGLASSTEELPSLMRDTASGITIFGVGLPDEAERAEIISALAISDETSSEVARIELEMHSARETALANRKGKIAELQDEFARLGRKQASLVGKISDREAEVTKTASDRVAPNRAAFEAARSTAEVEQSKLVLAKKKVQELLAPASHGVGEGDFVAFEGESGELLLRKCLKVKGDRFALEVGDGKPFCRDSGNGKFEVIYWRLASDGTTLNDGEADITLALPELKVLLGVVSAAKKESLIKAVVKIKSLQAKVTECAEARQRAESALAFVEDESKKAILADASVIDLKRKLDEAVAVSTSMSQEIIRLQGLADDYLEGDDSERYLQLVVARSRAMANRRASLAVTVAEAGRLTGGLTNRDVTEMLTLSGVECRRLERADVFGYKKEIITRQLGDMVSIIDPTYGFEGIGGMAALKQELAEAVHAIRSGDTRSAYTGIMLVGPPGTGKTAIATALATECGYSYLEVRNTRSMWQGETERRTRLLLDVIAAYAPVLILRDEIDQEDGGRDGFNGDSGVSNRVRQMWMTFMSDPRLRGKVLMISASNRPDLIDAAIKRSGRTDLIWPCLMPKSAERAKIFEVMFSKVRYGLSHDITDFSPFGEMSEGMSGADIEKVTQDSYRWAARRHERETVVHAADLRTVVEDFIPTDRKEVDRQIRLALENVRSKRLLAMMQ